MKVSYRWLQEYVPTPTAPEALAEKFRMTSSEVDSLTDWSKKLEHIVVGHVLTVEKHPDADRLHITEVDIGTGKKQIVCGAPNIAAGQYVLVALDGAKLTSMKGETITIGPVTLRGVRSEGMICATEELGVPFAKEGLFIFSIPVKPGTAASKALLLDDTVLDLEITPNRPDLLSYIGLAREIAAIEKRRLIEPPIAAIETQKSKKVPLHVTVESSKLCPRFTLLALEGVSTIPSPLWLQTRLLISGIRPINAIVDVTNYVMLELGQPLHAYDLDRLTPDSQGNYHFRVRTAHSKETISLLDGSTRSLHPDDIVISDAEDRPIDLAGIMGGSSSSISESTTRIVLESATFYAPNVRRTSLRLGLRSEASNRFEKGLDPETTITALKRATYLLQEICQAQPSGPLVDTYHRSRSERPRIALSFERVQQVLGTHISAQETKAILQKLGFQIPQLTKSNFDAVPPSWRKDVTLPEDIIEELARIWGYDRIPATLPTGAVKAPQPNRHFELMFKIRHLAAAEGLFETIHLPFVSQAALQRVEVEPELAERIPNPLSAETEYLTPTHVVPLLHNVAHTNLAREELGLLEIGKVFPHGEKEFERLTLLLRTAVSPEPLYRRMKSILASFARALPDQGNFSYKRTDVFPPYFIKGSALHVYYREEVVGIIGLIKPEVLENLKIRRGKYILIAELASEQLVQTSLHYPVYSPPSAYPDIERDLTLILNKDVAAEEIEIAVAKAIDAKLMLSWNIADIYSGKPLADTEKAVTLHFIYNAHTRTMEDSEANKDQDRLAKELRSKLKATIKE